VYHLTYEKNLERTGESQTKYTGNVPSGLSEKIGVTQGIWGINLMAEEIHPCRGGAIFEILGITGASLNPDGIYCFEI
jgi:hypothetical protein